MRKFIGAIILIVACVSISVGVAGYFAARSLSKGSELVRIGNRILQSESVADQLADRIAENISTRLSPQDPLSGRRLGFEELQTRHGLLNEAVHDIMESSEAKALMGDGMTTLFMTEGVGPDDTVEIPISILAPRLRERLEDVDPIVSTMIPDVLPSVLVERTRLKEVQVSSSTPLVRLPDFQSWNKTADSFRNIGLVCGSLLVVFGAVVAGQAKFASRVMLWTLLTCAVLLIVLPTGLYGDQVNPDNSIGLNGVVGQALSSYRIFGSTIFGVGLLVWFLVLAGRGRGFSYGPVGWIGKGLRVGLRRKTSASNDSEDGKKMFFQKL